MKHGIWVIACLLFVATACGDGEKGLGEQLGGAISDIDVVKEAEAAANKIIRNASDCEFVKSEVDGRGPGTGRCRGRDSNRNRANYDGHT